jgi:Tol biopolymer transport system component
VVSAGKLAFVSLTENADIWSIPADTNAARILGEPIQLTRHLGPDVNPNVTLAGDKAVWNSQRGRDEVDLVVYDFVTGEQRVALSMPVPGEGRLRNIVPRVSPDGTRLAYTSGERVGFTLGVDGSGAQPVCQDCMIRNWFPDGRRLVVSFGQVPQYLVGVLEGDRFTPLMDQVQGINAPNTSRDAKWLTFYMVEGGITRVYIIPISDRIVPKSEWIQVNKGDSWDTIPEFSPDDRLLYFLSDRLGTRDIWVQPLDPATKRPVGAPRVVHRFPGVRRTPLYNRVGQNACSIAKDKIVLPVTERTGNVWLADLPDR